MAWEHSYSTDAYDDAREKLKTWSLAQLVHAYMAYEQNEGAKREAQLLVLGYDIMEQLCMDAIIDVNLCDNGGWAMWIDFDGYHKVELPQ